MEKLKERLEKIDAYTFRNEWKAKLENARNSYRESNDTALKELSTLYDKRNVTSFDYVKKINNLIIDNNIRIKELTSIINGL